MKFQRVFLIVLDSFGVGALPDAAAYGDEGSNTLASVSASERFFAPNLTRLGLFAAAAPDADTIDPWPTAAFGKAAERSAGKDTVSGHWEIAGIVSERPMPVYPNGFPEDLLQKIEAATGIGALCNRPYSGTEVIRDYGREQKETGKMIVYTSADSVFQAAAHTDVIPLSKLYEYCETVRGILRDEHAVGRVIARPFRGEYPNYERTSDRHDYALTPSSATMLDRLFEQGYDTIAVGKISDIFAGRGITRRLPTRSNEDGLRKTEALLFEDFHGLCFVNLVDFDSLYGHRNDPDGYAEAISFFDAWLGGFLPKLGSDDLLLITADHGCDPRTESTDHSREYVPILACSPSLMPLSLGIRATFADVGRTVCEILGAEGGKVGESFADRLLPIAPKELLAMASEARKKALAPYSQYTVGAALLCADGSVVCGCNVESAAFSPTICAERTALVKAISEGKREFLAVAVVGGRAEETESSCTPCGVCRQMLYELGGEDLLVITRDTEGEPMIRRIRELLPDGFSGELVRKGEKE